MVSLAAGGLRTHASGRGLAAICGRLSPPGPEQVFRHDALLYSDEEQFLAGVIPFIQGALEADDPIVVALDRQKIGLVRSELGGDAGHVYFADMHELGVNPARLIPAWRQFIEAHAAPGTRIWGVGEPVWPGRSEAEVVECQLHESLLNVAFADAGPLSMLCPYDTAGLGEDVIAEVHRSHASVVQGGTCRASESFCEPADWAGPFGEPLPEPRGPVRVQAFGAGDLAEVRKLVALRARGAGLTASRADDLVLAVNEVASNSIRHAGGAGMLRIWSDGDTLLCEVQDRGRLRDPLAGRRRPDFTEPGGQGLWITNQVCDLVQLRSFSDGSAVRIHMRTRLTRATVRSRAEEPEDQHLNRNLDQLLQELRVVLPGVQVLFAFLLAVPFSSRFGDVDDFERDVYFVALLLAALSIVLLMAPSIQHRILFRREQKLYLVNLGNTLTIAGMTALALAIVLSLVLVAHFLFGPGAAWAAGGLAFGAFALLWYALPIERRITNRNPDHDPPPRGS